LLGAHRQAPIAQIAADVERLLQEVGLVLGRGRYLRDKFQKLGAQCVGERRRRL